MIKRRFYKREHGEGGGTSDSSSSSNSDSTREDEEEEEEEVHEVEEDDGADKVAAAAVEGEKAASSSSGSGYESEDSSGTEINWDSPGLLVNDYEDDNGKERKNLKARQLTGEDLLKNVVKASDTKDSTESEMADCCLKCKSVFKCKLCPRIVCLSEDTLMAHLRSKRHARSKKLLSEGRLKLMLNSDGEIDEDQETHAERHARTVALAQDSDALKSKNKGRQRQRQRRKMKLHNGCDENKALVSQKKQIKKRRKIED